MYDSELPDSLLLATLILYSAELKSRSHIDTTKPTFTSEIIVCYSDWCAEDKKELYMWFKRSDFDKWPSFPMKRSLAKRHHWRTLSDQLTNQWAIACPVTSSASLSIVLSVNVDPNRWKRLCPYGSDDCKRVNFRFHNDHSIRTLVANRFYVDES